MNTAIRPPRQEHPRPDFERSEWLNLNGEWQFEIDNGMSGEERGLVGAASLSGKITVPFCPESALSGIANTDYMNSVWYKRSFTVPSAWQGKRVFIRFEACDYYTTVWINGERVGTHRGGYTPFSFDITKWLCEGENTLTVRANDNTRDWTAPSGKQSVGYASEGCFYTRTTGIWQTVWLEAVAEERISSFRFDCDIEAPALFVNAALSSAACGCTVRAEVLYDGRAVGEASTVAHGSTALLRIELSEKHLWEVGKGELYDVVLTVCDGERELDRVKSYFGLRSVVLKDGKFLLNGKPVFQRLVLDQGFYPDGIYTAPDDEVLMKDIEYSMALGFNGARLHEKVFESRFLYHCDTHGYIVWGEFPDWGTNLNHSEPVSATLSQFRESMERDINHPAIIGWCPLNEVWPSRFYDKEAIKRIAESVKAFDPSRLLIDVSGGVHSDAGDIWDVHEYTQEPEAFKKRNFGEQPAELFPNDEKYDGRPLFLSEYGGIAMPETKDGWGYGNAPASVEEFYSRYDGLTTAILEDDRYMGFCYTQLYDVEQEKNGLMTYGREFKVDVERIRAVNTKPAAIEK